MKERLEAIKKAALEKIEQADAMDSLNDIRVSVLGKKGELTQVLKGMKDVAKEERPIVGQMVNDTRAVIEEALEKEMTLLKKKVREEKMKREVIDVTLPGKTHEKRTSSSKPDRAGRFRESIYRYGIRSCRRTRSRIR